MKKSTERIREIAKKLRDLVNESPYSTKQIASLCGVSEGLLGAYMYETEISFQDAIKLASFFEIRISDLLYSEIAVNSYPIGQRIKYLRFIKGGIKQEELAEYLGISVSQLSKIENGTSGVNVDMLYLLADFFKVSPSFIIGEIEYPTLQEYVKKRNKIDFQANRLKPFAQEDKFNEELFVVQDFEKELFKRSAGAENYCDNICDFIRSIVKSAYNEINIYNKNKKTKPISPDKLRYYLESMTENIILRYEDDLVEVGALEKSEFRSKETQEFDDFMAFIYEQNPEEFETEEIDCEQTEEETNSFFIDYD